MWKGTCQKGGYFRKTVPGKKPCNRQSENGCAVVPDLSDHRSRLLFPDCLTPVYMTVILPACQSLCAKQSDGGSYHHLCLFCPSKHYSMDWIPTFEKVLSSVTLYVLFILNLLSYVLQV